MIPAGLMYVYFGSAARSLADAAAGNVEQGLAGRIFFWFGLAATIAVATFVTRLARKSLQEAEKSVSVSQHNRKHKLSARKKIRRRGRRANVIPANAGIQTPFLDPGFRRDDGNNG